MVHIAGHEDTGGLPAGLTEDDVQSFMESVGIQDREQAIEFLTPERDEQFLGVPIETFEDSAGHQPFTQFDPYRHIQNLAPGQYRRLQDTLVTVGLLDPEAPFIPGEITPNDPTFEALGNVMSYANTTGKNLDGALRELQQLVMSPDFDRDDIAELAGRGSGRQERGRYYQLPDTATLKARVRGQFKQALGRNPTAQEMQAFTDEMMADYQSEIARQKDQFETVEAGGDVTTQQVDPVARFQEAFQQRMGGQIRSIETQEDTAAASRASERQVDVAEREALR